MTYDEFVERCNAVAGRRFRVTPKGVRGQYRSNRDSAQNWLRDTGRAGTLTDRVRGMVWTYDDTGRCTLTDKGETVEGVR